MTTLRFPHLIKRSEKSDKIDNSPKWLQKKINQSKRFIGEQYLNSHVDFAAQLLTIILGVGLTTITYSVVVPIPSQSITNANNSTSELVASENRVKDLFEVGAIAATFFGLLITATNIHDQNHQSQKARASDYVQTWYNDAFSEKIKTLRRLKKKFFDEEIRNWCIANKRTYHLYSAEELKEECPAQLERIQEMVLEHLKLEEKNKKPDMKNDTNDVDDMLTFFEQMGQDVRFDVVDEKYLKEFFFLIVTNYYEIFQKYIDYTQKEWQNRTIYCNFEYLAKLWEEWRVRPAVPRLCIEASPHEKEE